MGYDVSLDDPPPFPLKISTVYCVLVAATDSKLVFGLLVMFYASQNPVDFQVLLLTIYWALFYYIVTFPPHLFGVMPPVQSCVNYPASHEGWSSDIILTRGGGMVTVTKKSMTRSL